MRLQTRKYSLAVTLVWGYLVSSLSFASKLIEFVFKMSAPTWLPLEANPEVRVDFGLFLIFETHWSNIQTCANYLPSARTGAKANSVIVVIMFTKA